MKDIMNNEHTPPIPQRSFSLQQTVSILLSLAGIGSIIFFFPFFGVSLDVAKMSFLSLLVIVSLILWAISRLKEGTLVLPWSLPALALLLLVGITVFSAIFSEAIQPSFWGAGYETTTASATIILATLFFLASLFIRTPKQVTTLYGGFICVLLVVGVYEIIRFFFGPDVLSFGIFNNILANPIGKWNDLALLYGLFGTVSLLALSSFSPRGVIRVFLFVAYGLSLTLLFLVNFSLAWGLFAFSAIAILGFILMTKRDPASPETTPNTSAPLKFSYRMPLLPLVSAIIAIIFLLPGNTLADLTGGRLGLSNIEVRPSWSATFDVVKASVKENPFLGVGPNRFADAWLVYKPEGVNNTLFWNTEFEQGIGIIPSTLVTMSVLGMFFWLFFLLSFARAGVRATFVPREDTHTSVLFFGSFLAAVYLFLAMILYVPGAALVILAFLFAGVTLGMIARENPAQEKTLIFAENPRIGFISVLALVVVLIFSAVGAYAYLSRFLGTAYAGAGVEALTTGDLSRAEEKLTRAKTFFPHDSVLRIKTEVAIARMRAALTETADTTGDLQIRFQETLGNAVSEAREAIVYDETNYQNWITLGRVYESIVPLKIEGAYENAKAAYERAAVVNPKNPAMILTLARLEAARGDLGMAREYLGKAIEMKGDYTEAIFALAQLEAEEGNVKKAIEETRRASLIAPNDIGVFFQLGFLLYTARDYSGAVEALERTVFLNPVYANAKYFLGLSYAKLGRTGDAITQFEGIQTLNPDNEEVERILGNLRTGNNPFASVVPPEEPPEKRQKPPIEE